MSCPRDSEDRLLNALVKKGINLIVPPRDNLASGNLIIGSGKDARRASWQSVFGINLSPATVEGKGFESFTFEAQSVLAVSAAAGVIGRVLQAFGLQSGKVSGAFSSAKADKIQLSLVAPASNTLADIDAVLDALRQNKVTPAKGYNGNTFYVAETVWRARGLRLDILDKNARSLELSGEVMEELKPSGNLKFEREGTGAYAYLADKALVFGICLRRFESDEQGVISDFAVNEHLPFRGAPAAHLSFIGDDAFVDLGRDDGEPS